MSNDRVGCLTYANLADLFQVVSTMDSLVEEHLLAKSGLPLSEQGHVIEMV
jgi:hypothetical protein